jgi:hypothetical protein
MEKRLGGASRGEVGKAGRAIWLLIDIIPCFGIL